jgi:hypothetical protein
MLVFAFQRAPSDRPETLFRNTSQTSDVVCLQVIALAQDMSDPTKSQTKRGPTAASLRAIDSDGARHDDGQLSDLRIASLAVQGVSTCQLGCVRFAVHMEGRICHTSVHETSAWVTPDHLFYLFIKKTRFAVHKAYSSHFSNSIFT